jgi:hypothetical protein
MTEKYTNPLDSGRRKLFDVATSCFEASDFSMPDEEGKQISKLLMFGFAGYATAIIGKKAESELVVAIPGNDNHEVYELSIYDEVVELATGESFGNAQNLLIQLYFTDKDHQVLDGRDLPPEFFGTVADSLLRQKI